MLQEIEGTGKRKGAKSFTERFADELIGNGLFKMNIGPAEAKIMLAQNKNNRPVSNSTVTKYAKRMTGGEWHYTRVPIIFSESGILIDGQHRLFAVVESGETITADVAFGASDESFAFIDVGKKRTAADIFAINGVPNHTGTAAAMKWVWGYQRDRMGTVSSDGGTTGVSEAELYEEYLQNTDLQKSCKVLYAFTRNRLASPAMMMGLHYICALKSRAAADEFFDKVGTGVGITEKNDPALVLRNKLIDNAASEKKYSKRAIAGLVINAWNIFRAGGSGRGLRYYPDKPFPRVR